MTPVFRFRKGSSPIAQATEPRSYDRRFYARALLVGFLVIILTVGFLIYHFVFKTVEEETGPTFDLASLFIEDSATLPDPANPCIALQEHLEATRNKSYQKAYEYLSDGLRETISIDDFIANATSNSLLFADVSAYDFNSYVVGGSLATVSGYIRHDAGGKSRVEATFTREEDGWKISGMTMVYQ